MHKLPKELLQQLLNTIALGIFPNQSYLQINQLINKLSNLEQINEDGNLESKSGVETQPGVKGAKKEAGK